VTRCPEHVGDGNPVHTPEWVVAALGPFLKSEATGIRPARRLIHWRFESRYFSSLIYFTLATDGSQLVRLVAKFPKAARGRGFSYLPPRTPDDLELAAYENRALQDLSRSWPPGETAFVEPRF